MGREMNTLDTVKEVIAAYLDINVDTIGEQTELVEDLGLDSLDSIELVMEIEEKMGLELADDDMDGIKTVGQLADVIERARRR